MFYKLASFKKHNVDIKLTNTAFVKVIDNRNCTLRLVTNDLWPTSQGQHTASEGIVCGPSGSFYYPTYFFLFWVFSINPCVSLFICPHFEFLRNTRVPMETVRPWFWISEIKERKNRRNSI